MQSGVAMWLTGQGVPLGYWIYKRLLGGKPYVYTALSPWCNGRHCIAPPCSTSLAACTQWTHYIFTVWGSRRPSVVAVPWSPASGVPTRPVCLASPQCGRCITAWGGCVTVVPQWVGSVPVLPVGSWLRVALVPCRCTLMRKQCLRTGTATLAPERPSDRGLELPPGKRSPATCWLLRATKPPYQSGAGGVESG